MNLTDSELHVRGSSHFIDDLPEPENTLHAAVFQSPIASGKIDRLDFVTALEGNPQVLTILTAKDIPGENQIGTIIPDEPLFAGEFVHYIGQSIALVVASDRHSALTAVQKITCGFKESPAIFDPREAFKCGELIAPPRTFSMGNPDLVWPQCDIIVNGRVDCGGQEHLYLETQGALAIPLDDGSVKIFAGTQSPSQVQKVTARVLNLPMNKVVVEVPRLGGAFGGKEDQATPWAAMAALAAYLLKRPVKLVLSRQQDMRCTGKRHPYSIDYKLGLSRERKILAYEVYFYQNAGAAADLSTAILERTLFHVTNSYFIPHVKATAACCRTNFPPNTAFRGFGAPQAIFAIECAIYHAAQMTHIDPTEIQSKNLIHEGEYFPYGQRAENCQAEACWDATERHYYPAALEKECQEFNSANVYLKKSWARIPICFGISFTTTTLNQASALVHVYTDGSVMVSTSAVEMGQGVKAKIGAVVAKAFSIKVARVKVASTDTMRIANMSPTAASTGADMNGHAARLACQEILNRLYVVAAEQLTASSSQRIQIKDERIYLNDRETDLTWEQLVRLAFLQRKSLSAQAHYATPDLFFDRKLEKGQPFAYHVYGHALVQATVDCLRGTFHFNSVQVVHDVGKSLHRQIDLGQIEGGTVQGLGWMALEELCYDSRGRLLSDSMTTYKVPDIYFAPDRIEVELLDQPNPKGLYHSKAVGEPPFLYGIAGYFAIIKAMRNFRNDCKITFHSPMTPEKILLALYDA